ncbi:hypothetical protein MJO28_006566 [Puccinia striiformis f. sp. tritici]|uniref:Uncharacterized protein n=1 Tax=Puccinia striiformis f. sp. tritici TaxID=168172 RepID=A0ACC0EIK5_9BASI|nr:hypothetical protein MJO28_006566 [Puccinia striiformis f. sp. tritici]
MPPRKAQKNRSLADQAASTSLPAEDESSGAKTSDSEPAHVEILDDAAITSITKSLAMTVINPTPGPLAAKYIYDTCKPSLQVPLVSYHSLRKKIEPLALWMTSPFLNTCPVFTYAVLVATMFTILHPASNLSSAWLLRRQHNLIELSLCSGLSSNSKSRSLTTTESLALDKLPVNMDTAIKWLKLEPVIVFLNCCSRCFATYPPNRTPRFCVHQDDPMDEEEDLEDDVDGVREKTTTIDPSSKAAQPSQNAEATISSPMCGQALWQPDKHVPIRKFAFQRLNNWLARFYSRPGIEDALDKSLSSSSPDVPDLITDIHDSPIWREFKAPNGSPFTASSGNLIFGLFIDGINPYGSKQGGKHVSITFVVLVCLTLPYALRFLPENIFLVGIAPGPKEPSLTQTNWILNPLVQQLKSLWDVGLYLSCTPRHPEGRHIFAALLPVFADLPALRRAVGFAGHASGNHMCSFCTTKKKEIRNLDRDSWTPRTSENHIQWAHASRDANNAKERQQIFKNHGVRYSVLTDLPYWKPIEFQALDSMHNLLLGLFKWHTIRFWAISNKQDSEDDQPDAVISATELLEMSASVISDPQLEEAEPHEQQSPQEENDNDLTHDGLPFFREE